MIAIVDTNFVINQSIPIEKISKGFIPSLVSKEIKDKTSQNYFDFVQFNIECRDPSDEYVQRVRDAIKGKHFGISEPDIYVVALTLEISDECSNCWIGHQNINSIEEVVCLTEDNGIKSALSLFGLSPDPSFIGKKFKLRCYCCFKTYDEDVDFCKNCGYSTITKVTVADINGQEKICLKSNYLYKERVIKGNNGVIFKCADQKEYVRFKEDIQRQERKKSENLSDNFFE